LQAVTMLSDSSAMVDTTECRYIKGSRWWIRISVKESIAAGKPMVMIPLIADQFRNAKLGEYRGFGITVDKANFTAMALSEAIDKLVNNERYATMI
jgi:UDP-N-acetylglucosamine:LPS N-acetylglucosamine transferase